ncbi:MAG TPA: hypothetical protein VH120_21235 [Gemmataceae bacterium]|nr:hypothetical protein [Gemmataceae bacterium]
MPTKTIYLGPWPAGVREPSAQVRAAYDRLIGEWRTSGRRPLPSTVPQSSLTVGELILRFWSHVETHYRHPDGTPTGEVDGYRLSLRPLRRLYSQLPAAELSPLKLKAVRESMIEADLCRGVIDQRVGRIVRMFRWAVTEELISETHCVSRGTGSCPSGSWPQRR